MAKKFNGNQRNNEEKRAPHNNNRARREPEYTEDQKVLATYFENNIKEYLANKSEDEQAIRNLMTLPDRAPFVSNGILGVQVECDVHLLLRSIRTDRETGELIRASATFVAIDMNAIPGYVIDMYLNKNYTGMITVTPITDRGPDFRNAYRVKIGQPQE